MTEGIMMITALKKYRLAGMIAVSLAGTSGCSSVMTHTGSSQGYYPGTRASAEVLTDKESSWAMKPLAAIDLPFSAAMDTLLLPWDYYRAGDTNSTRERIRRSEEQNQTNAGLAQSAPLVTPAPRVMVAPQQ